MFLNFRMIIQYIQQCLEHKPINTLIFWSRTSEFSYCIGSLMLVQVWFYSQVNSSQFSVVSAYWKFEQELWVTFSFPEENSFIY